MRMLDKSCLSLVVALATLVFGRVSSASAQELSGSWRGRWEDCKSGHSGPLRGCLEKCDEQHYRARFSGRFFGVVPFCFSAVLTVTGQEGDKVLLSGSSNLGPFGTFTYSGWATSSEFVADYSSSRWQGRFMLAR